MTEKNEMSEKEKQTINKRIEMLNGIIKVKPEDFNEIIKLKAMAASSEVELIKAEDKFVSSIADFDEKFGEGLYALISGDKKMVEKNEKSEEEKQAINKRIEMLNKASKVKPEDFNEIIKLTVVAASKEVELIKANDDLASKIADFDEKFGEGVYALISRI